MVERELSMHEVPEVLPESLWLFFCISVKNVHWRAINSMKNSFCVEIVESFCKETNKMLYYMFCKYKKTIHLNSVFG